MERTRGVIIEAFGQLLDEKPMNTIIGYFSEDLYCLAFRYDLAYGLLLLVMGAIVLVKFAIKNQVTNQKEF